MLICAPLSTKTVKKCCGNRFGLTLYVGGIFVEIFNQHNLKDTV